jgi:hypothetical protein
VHRFAALLALFAALAACRCNGSSLPGSAPPAASSSETEAAGLRFVERLTGGASPSERLPLIIGIHGYGGSPEHFGRVLTTLRVRARVILPYGTTRRTRSRPARGSASRPTASPP